MSTPILIRVAKALYRADPSVNKGDFDSLPAAEKRRYESMAAAALSIILLEPVPEPILAANISL